MRRRHVLLAVAAALGALLAPAPSASAATATDWYAYHGDAARSGYSAAVPAVGSVAKVWSARLDGPVYASPLVVRDQVVVATEGNSLYGFDRAGRQLWHYRDEAPVPLSKLPCGNIDPVGITGTPVYDPTTNQIYAVVTKLVNGRVRHQLIGVRPGSGHIASRRWADPAGQDPTVLNQRGALAFTRGHVLVTYGGHAGDCGAYHGYLMSFSLDTKAVATYRTGTVREAGMWQPSGPTLEGDTTVLVVTGNGSQTSGAWDGGNAVHRLNPINARRYSYFAPSDWAEGNRVDADLGSSGATLIGRRIWTQGKTNVGYLLDATNLGGIGRPLATVRDACASQFGGSAVHGSSAFLPCTDGIRKITVSGNSVALGWKAASTVTGSPVVGGGAVWTLDPGAGVLYALKESDGSVLARVDVGPTTRFATPALSGSLVLVPVANGIVAVRSS